MKQGKYITCSIILACLSATKNDLLTAEIHQELATTIAERKQLFAQYKKMTNASTSGIHQDLVATIAERSQLFEQYKKMFSQFTAVSKPLLHTTNRNHGAEVKDVVRSGSVEEIKQAA